MRNIFILYVDHDYANWLSGFNLFTESFASDYDIKIIPASDISEAMSILKEKNDLINAVIMECDFPKETRCAGDLLKHIDDNFPFMPVGIIASGKLSDKKKEEMHSFGAQIYVLEEKKDTNPELVLEQILGVFSFLQPGAAIAGKVKRMVYEVCPDCGKPEIFQEKKYFEDKNPLIARNKAFDWLKKSEINPEQYCHINLIVYYENNLFHTVNILNPWLLTTRELIMQLHYEYQLYKKMNVDISGAVKMIKVGKKKINVLKEPVKTDLFYP